MTKTYRIAVIPGDGIGKEVIREGVKVVQAAADLYDFAVEMVPFDFSSAEYYVEHGQMLPADWFEQLHKFDAILFGAVGWPDLVPDHVSLWGSLLQFRRGFDQYVSLRPVKLLPGVTRACLLIDSEVDHDGGQGDATEECQCVFVVPGGDSTPLLEA